MTGVLFVDHADAVGGAEQIALLLLTRLDASWKTRLVCGGGVFAERAQAQGIPVTIFTLPRLRRSWRAPGDLLEGARGLARAAAAADTALLHANTVRAAPYTALAARLARRPFVWHMHDFWLSEGQPRYLAADTLGKRLIGDCAAAVIANSRAVAASLPCPATVVYNGIASEHFDPALDGQPFRAQHAIPLEAPLVGMVGRLRPWKGQQRFLHMAARVLRAVPGAYFALIGGDPFAVQDGYAERLPALAADLGLGERVVFSGQLDDVRPALAALDLFVHPGDPEPFGIVNIEAMAMGRPIVAFGHGALPEIVAEGETGLLVQPGDEAALAAAVVALLGNDERRAALGRAGRSRAVRLFDIRRTAAEVAAVFERVLSSA